MGSLFGAMVAGAARRDSSHRPGGVMGGAAGPNFSHHTRMITTHHDATAPGALGPQSDSGAAAGARWGRAGEWGQGVGVQGAAGRRGAAGGAVTPAPRPLQGGTAVAGQRALGVLVVDDSAVFRRGMTRAVEACDGLRLLGEADGGEAALRAIVELQPDVVICDLRMPDLDAFGVLGGLHALDPPPPCRVVIISATLDDAVEAELLAAGAADCLSKALSRADICAAAIRVTRE
jgi:CheY-like chemotaxis protein